MELQPPLGAPPTLTSEDEWLWGWDPTPGIVSVWAEPTGHAVVWRRIPATGELVREDDRFRPWALLDRLDDLQHLGAQLAPDGTDDALVTYRELSGPGALRYLVSAGDGKTLSSAVLHGASHRLGKEVGHLRELGSESVLAASARGAVPRRRPAARTFEICHSTNCDACSSTSRPPDSIRAATASS